MNAPIPSITAHQGIVSRISVEGTSTAQRFVISLMVAAHLALTECLAQIAQYSELIARANQAIDKDPNMVIADKLAFEDQIKIAKSCIAKLELEKPTLKDRALKYYYFSTPLGSPDSVRINAQQLRNAFPELMGLMPDEKVFQQLLIKRSTFIGREVHFTESPQIDKATGKPKINDKTKEPYTNIRLEASSEDLCEADALKLLGGLSLATAAVTQTPENVEDVPM